MRALALCGLAATLTLLGACGTQAPSSPAATPAPVPTAASPAPATARPTPTPVATGVAGLEIVLLMPDGGSPLPVRLFDETGLALELAAVPFGAVPLPEGLSNPAGVENVLLLSWVGGACDTSTTLTFERRGEGYRLTLATVTAPGPCILIGLGRQVSIRLAAPVDADSVTLVTG